MTRYRYRSTFKTLAVATREGAQSLEFIEGKSLGLLKQPAEGMRRNATTSIAGVLKCAREAGEQPDSVEQGKLDGPEVEEMLQGALKPLFAEHIDVLVLGCTHFPVLRPAIERVMGKHVLVIDNGVAIARRTRAVLEAEELIHPQNQHEKGDLQVWCSGDERMFSKVASKILGYPVIVQHATL